MMTHKSCFSTTFDLAAAAVTMFAATPATAGGIVLQGIVALACTATTTDAGAGARDLCAIQTNLTRPTVTNTP